MGFFKDPKPDPRVDPFRDGVAELRKDGRVVGHVATTVGTFRTPFMPRTAQWWVWFVVVWSDGKKEQAFEDYPPWTAAVKEAEAGIFDWTVDPDDPHAGIYDFTWLEPADAARVREEVGIQAEDF